MLELSLRRSKFVAMLGAVCLLLVGCMGEQLSPPLPISTFESPTQTPRRLTPTLLATPSRTSSPTWLPSASPTQLLRLTHTLKPSGTTLPTLSPAEQTTLAAITQSVATAVARSATEIAIFPRCVAVNDRSYSPDGKWVAIECIDNMTGVYNLDDLSKVWTLRYYETFGLEHDRGNQFGDLLAVHWSRDGQFLYLMPFPCCLDGGCPAYHEGLALLRLEVATGKITQTLRPEGEFKFYNVSFSEDDTYLAYFRTWLKNPILNIVNLVTGEEQHIPLGDRYSEAGDVIWSPDKTRVVLSARKGEDCESMIYYLVMIQLSDLSQTILLEGAATDYTPIEWTTDNRIIVSMYDIGYSALDVNTLEMTPYWPDTPMPRP